MTRLLTPVSEAIATVDGLRYSYPSSSGAALQDVTLEVPAGAFMLLAGPSAGGKSTLLRVFNGLVPQFHGGKISGLVRVAGLDPSRTPTRVLASKAGMVFQEPEAQAIAETVEEEVAFGMEQQGIPPGEMARRIDAVLEMLGIGRLRGRRLQTLSGGERQRVAIAAVLALGPHLLLMDEPTSQLDPAGADAVLDAVQALHARGDMAVVVAEHRLERLLHRVDAVAEVDGGRVRAMGPREASAVLAAVPPVCALARKFGLPGNPLTIEEALPGVQTAGLRAAPRAAPNPGAELIRLDSVTVSYGAHLALREASLTLREGEVVALVGPNGSGKTTLFRAITGLSQPDSGQVWFAGRPAPEAIAARTAHAGMVPQDPALALYQETVAEEVAETLRHRRGRPGVGELSRALDRWGVSELAGRNPRDISVGQQQRVAVAAMLAHEPRVWLLDEPTRGADGAAKAWLAQTLREHARNGGAALVATHDIESAAQYATRVIALDDGRVRYDLPVAQALGHGGAMPTQVARLVPGALTIDEVSR